MIRARKWSRRGLLVVGATAALAAIGFSWNVAPKVPPVAAAGLANENRPTLVKVHAQWCPVCLLGKGTWNRILALYGDRVDFVIFDVTNKGSIEASRAEAKRLGLQEVFDEYSREPGMVLVLERSSRRVKSSVPGLSASRVYAEAIEEALRIPASQGQPGSPKVEL